MSSKSSMRIVLVDPLGDILFSGESLSVREGHPLGKAGGPPDSSAAASERCPETLRSAEVSESGVFRTVARESYVDDLGISSMQDPPVIEEVSGEIRHVQSRRPIRAA